MKEITTTIYEADDGTRFDLKGACEEYEKRMEINKMFDIVKTIPHKLIPHDDLFASGSPDSHMIMFKPKTREQFDALVEWCNTIGVPVSANPKSYYLEETLVIPEAYTGSELAELEDINTDYLYGSLQTLNNYIGSFANELILYSTNIGKE